MRLHCSTGMPSRDCTAAAAAILARRPTPLQGHFSGTWWATICSPAESRNPVSVGFVTPARIAAHAASVDKPTDVIKSVPMIEMGALMRAFPRRSVLETLHADAPPTTESPAALRV